MTIIQPHKNRPLIRFLFFAFLLLAVGGTFYIFEYNAVVDARQGIVAAKEALVKAQNDNADLKDALYQAIDPTALKALAATEGLTLVNNPQYLSQAPWPSVSSR
jgi:hypothetical protein